MMNHSIFEMLRHAVVHYGYFAVAATLLLENVGLPLPGETILLIASFLAYSEHELQLAWIIVVATAVATRGSRL
jgi:membrane protein DedA with SNARE-associated domain